MYYTYDDVYKIKINMHGSGVMNKVGGANPQCDKASDDRRTTRVCVCSTPRAVSYPKTMGSIISQKVMKRGNNFNAS